MKPQRPKADVTKPFLKAGEGTLISAHAVPVARPDGTTGFNVGFDLSEAPVPDRRYQADVASVIYRDETVKLLLGQQRVMDDSLSTLLMINMNPQAALQFVDSVDSMDSPGLAAIMETERINKAELYQITSEPDQAVSLVANVVAVAVTGRETTLDFYHASAFSFMQFKTAKKLAIDSVVRIYMRTALFASVIDELKGLAPEFPAGTRSKT